MGDRTVEINIHFDTEKKQVTLSSYEPETSMTTEIGTFPFHGRGESILENIGDEVYSWISMWIDEIEESEGK